MVEQDSAMSILEQRRNELREQIAQKKAQNEAQAQQRVEALRRQKFEMACKAEESR